MPRFSKNGSFSWWCSLWTYCSCLATWNTCGKCCALVFQDEQHKNINKKSKDVSYSLCCSYDSVQVPPVSEPPALLRTLLSGNSSTCHHFMQNIWAYNSVFAFALMTLTGHEFAFQGTEPYCFRINGQVYHTFSQLLPESGVAPKFPLLYLYDAAAELNAWLNIFSNLHKEIVCDLQEMINYVNPYMSLYYSVWDLLNANPAQDVRTLIVNSTMFQQVQI